LKVEFGTGNKPSEGFLHCDTWKHSPHVDKAFDLETLPWPFEDSSVEEIRAVDVFEHLRPWRISTQQWIDECFRILVSGGTLDMRLPAFDNPYSWRDPTHYRVYHPESFLYWCPGPESGTVWKDFGRYYFGEGYNKWWKQESVKREFNDLRFRLVKI
jgi:hypothetical protein